MLSLTALDPLIANEETFRVIHLQVLQVDGEPDANRDVELRGFDRTNIGPIPFLYDNAVAPPTPDDFRKARLSGWLFTTNSKGEVDVPIGNFAGWKDKKNRPGGGSYAFVVEPGPDDAGAVSQRFWIPANTSDMKFIWWDGEWGIPVPLPSNGLHLAMAVQKGVPLYGQLVDDRDHRTPVPNIVINTWNDLNVDTHTGYGGEIFRHSTRSDANGEFRIDHLFYAKLHLKPDAVWMTSSQGGKWVTQDEDVLDPPNEQGARVTMGIIVNPDFHYTGTVKDAMGIPVANADVVVGISSEPKAETYGDTHHFERTKTDAQGHYDLAASSPWGTFLEAEDPTHGRVDLAWPGYDSPPIPPGKYDLIFPAIPNPAK